MGTAPLVGMGRLRLLGDKKEHRLEKERARVLRERDGVRARVGGVCMSKE